ncbi:hypothetical protein FOE78_04180 [Microlunatus elymi]|uniref:Uncharacterized protein n=1 Tax=Microlunatus elymi TaxID=2596828 RepID=A0A516PVK4_9ACTN|nr:hypothetical protein [Microlunatus elymi]QDP95216.1 hypothetical protein FOE78_04180 [Microlunatus elymi]
MQAAGAAGSDAVDFALAGALGFGFALFGWDLAVCFWALEADGLLFLEVLDADAVGVAAADVAGADGLLDGLGDASGEDPPEGDGLAAGGAACPGLLPRLTRNTSTMINKASIAPTTRARLTQ